MLTLRRKEEYRFGSEKSSIDIEYGNEAVTLSLMSIVNDDNSEPVGIWKIATTDWGSEKYYPKHIGLTNNQPLLINDWLKVYGASFTLSGEAVIHLSAPKDAIINRRDRK